MIDEKLLIRLTKSLINFNGNLKIGKNTLIFNITSAYNCPSDKLKLCGLSKVCYAKKAEKQYPKVKQYRDDQEKLWDLISVDVFVKTILEYKNIKYIRFNESGDFRTQQDIEKIIDIANKLYNNNIIIYFYTKRKDLDWSKALLIPNLVITGSGFMLDNNFIVIESLKQFNPKKDVLCNRNCRYCDLCKNKLNNTIKILLH